MKNLRKNAKKCLESGPRICYTDIKAADRGTSFRSSDGTDSPEWVKREITGVTEMIETWTIPVEPITGSVPRKVYVYLPRKAGTDTSVRFPVLYMFDGHNVFFDSDATYGKSWGMGRWLDETDTGLIVVAIDCDHRPPFARISEYSPFTFDNEWCGHIEGRGNLFMDWITGTLKPVIDRRYPTLPDRENTWIAGSSMGGLMSLYAVSAYNHIFSRAAALSPAVPLVQGRMADLIRRTEFAPNTVVYLDYGAREAGGRQDILGCFRDTADALLERGVAVTGRIVPNGDHCEASWEEQIPFFMRILFYSRM